MARSTIGDRYSTLARQLTLNAARVQVPGPLALPGRQRRGDAGRLSREPALRDLAQERVRVGVTRHVPAGA